MRLPPDPVFVSAFWSHVADVDEHGHRRWLAGCSDDGYGIFTWPGPDGRRVKFRAHRVALELTAGPAPVGAPWALHRWPCHLRECVAGDHLYWGTPLQNSADRDAPARRAQLRSARDAAGGQLRLL